LLLGCALYLRFSASSKGFKAMNVPVSGRA
jgi:hypothetical protein